jgi:hypothetical protein
MLLNFQMRCPSALFFNLKEPTSFDFESGELTRLYTKVIKIYS